MTSRYETLASRVQMQYDHYGASDDYESVLNVLEVLHEAEQDGITDARELADAIYDRIAQDYSGDAAGFFDQRAVRLGRVIPATQESDSDATD
jgi:hypothetical protein